LRDLACSRSSTTAVALRRGCLAFRGGIA
jgi:hypothetical protein